MKMKKNLTPYVRDLRLSLKLKRTVNDLEVASHIINQQLDAARTKLAMYGPTSTKPIR